MVIICAHIFCECQGKEATNEIQCGTNVLANGLTHYFWPDERRGLFIFARALKTLLLSGHKQVCSQFVSVQVCLGPRKWANTSLVLNLGPTTCQRTCYEPVTSKL